MLAISQLVPQLKPPHVCRAQFAEEVEKTTAMCSRKPGGCDGIEIRCCYIGRQRAQTIQRAKCDPISTPDALPSEEPLSIQGTNICVVLEAVVTVVVD
jgi:hypothetical protein